MMQCSRRTRATLIPSWMMSPASWAAPGPACMVSTDTLTLLLTRHVHATHPVWLVSYGACIERSLLLAH